jgi:hypothetical protein
MNSATNNTPQAAFIDGSSFTAGTRVYSLNQVSRWTALNGKQITSGRASMHCTASGHGWAGEITESGWTALQPQAGA